MHLSDALLSPPVALAAGAVSLTLLAVAVRKLRRTPGGEAAAAGGTSAPLCGERLVPLMGVMGAFVFAAQMINFSIPGTGSSGHLVGGILLATILGPWAALVVLSSVLAVQCLLFADGGLLALGANIFNMAVLSCLVVWPLVFRPIAGAGDSLRRLAAASVAASVAALAAGALAVTLETEASGITALPLGRFLLFMLPIHLLIGVGEGAATAAVLCFLKRYRPDLAAADAADAAGAAGAADVAGAVGVAGAAPPGRRKARRRLLALLAAVTLAAALSFSWVASSDPDGLEWSVEQTAGAEPPAAPESGLHRTASRIRERTALMPDYGTSLSGVVGSGVVLLAVLGLSHLFRAEHRES